MLHNVTYINSKGENKRIEFANDFTFIAGRNGSGKTTLIKAIRHFVENRHIDENGIKNINIQKSSDKCELIYYAPLEADAVNITEEGWWHMVEAIGKDKEKSTELTESIIRVLSDSEYTCHIEGRSLLLVHPTGYVQNLKPEPTPNAFAGIAYLLACFHYYKNKNVLLLCDLPETRIHIGCQRMLIRELTQGKNPNMQIIIATHSPAIISNHTFNLRHM
ncbi:AAA family ATPase [Photobacterium kishitanii]|uniref:Endonuclease GajA/Old nuclease/RecF-like AAA domain-containing protein n=1 Tax=Photobacterium kishitanii TaxID=318456 RepID=A0A2T3KLG2_9GAMM|nr:ATP-binding protein [Photobacterium kishitanii]PSV00487.1 hypothetical protein C9J27_04965 [Photobacterium kishitanii]